MALYNSVRDRQPEQLHSSLAASFLFCLSSPPLSPPQLGITHGSRDQDERVVSEDVLVTLCSFGCCCLKVVLFPNYQMSNAGSLCCVSLLSLPQLAWCFAQGIRSGFVKQNEREKSAHFLKDQICAFFFLFSFLFLG